MITSALFIDARGDVPFVLIKGKVVSLHALEHLTPNMVSLLEQLAGPDLVGQVVRIDREAGEVRLKRMGVVAHALSKAVGKR